MSIKLKIGVSKKVGQPDYGSLGASCHIELEAESTSLDDDRRLKQQIQQAYSACRDAVDEELARNSAPRELKHVMQASRRSRMITQRQRQAIEMLCSRKRIDLTQIVHDQCGATSVQELSLQQASQLIDELNAMDNSQRSAG